jgi:hypothetical protein
MKPMIITLPFFLRPTMAMTRTTNTVVDIPTHLSRSDQPLRVAETQLEMTVDWCSMAMRSLERLKPGPESRAFQKAKGSLFRMLIGISNLRK